MAQGWRLGAGEQAQRPWGSPQRQGITCEPSTEAPGRQSGSLLNYEPGVEAPGRFHLEAVGGNELRRKGRGLR